MWRTTNSEGCGVENVVIFPSLDCMHCWFNTVLHQLLNCLFVTCKLLETFMFMWIDLYQNITVFVCRKKYTLHAVWPVFKNLRGSTASRLPVNTVRMKESSKTWREWAAKTAASAAMVKRTCQCSLFMVDFMWSGSLLFSSRSLQDAFLSRAKREVG